MRLPTINGREAVPVRAIPYFTRSDPLSADVLARVLSEQWRGHKWAARAHQLGAGGQLFTWLPGQWDEVCEQISAEEARISREQLSEEEGWVERDARVLELLPAGVFLWRDELEREYARTFGKPDYVPPEYDEDVGLDSANEGLSPKLQVATCQHREGDRTLVIDGMPEPTGALRYVLLDGFDDDKAGPLDGRGLIEYLERALECLFRSGSSQYPHEVVAIGIKQNEAERLALLVSRQRVREREAAPALLNDASTEVDECALARRA